ncbi:MAG: hypothetical protein EZS28_038522 [Streblomastix strix]|uniref:Uncharacterized protein n=1 Tax=Streblomastix strix TaxID=222440 RepID=A0A5J4U7T8_9EUKA|nr:MAG: hypothetical protein EZS28_038522 [Streblomastix strix]
MSAKKKLRKNSNHLHKRAKSNLEQLKDKNTPEGVFAHLVRRKLQIDKDTQEMEDDWRHFLLEQAYSKGKENKTNHDINRRKKMIMNRLSQEFDSDDSI